MSSFIVTYIVSSFCSLVDSRWCQAAHASYWPRTWSAIAREKLRWKLPYLWQREARWSVSQFLGTNASYVFAFFMPLITLSGQTGRQRRSVVNLSVHRMNQFWCQLARVIHEAKAWNNQLWGQVINSPGHMKPRVDLEAWQRHHSLPWRGIILYPGETSFSTLAEASFSTLSGGVDLLVVYCFRYY